MFFPHTAKLVSKFTNLVLTSVKSFSNRLKFCRIAYLDSQILNIPDSYIKVRSKMLKSPINIKIN